jgi:ATP-dependent DNA helicase RecQ/Werner syndrome ATP-dependent helicase
MGEFSDYDDDDGDFANYDMDAAIAANSSLRSNASLTKVNSDDPSPPAKKSRPTVTTTASTHDSANVSVASNQGYANDANIVDNDTPIIDDDNTNNYDDDDNVPTQFTTQLTNALVSHFGHSTFRRGQLSVLHSIMARRRDTCVFWATGAGKSLCYQLPPIHTNTVCIVVSPLISLMEDQVAKLNGRGSSSSSSSNEIAAFLGSSQTDPTVEQRALQGEYRLIYVTPEKLTSGSGSFLSGLAQMHARGGHGTICLFAIDESHCVSEWGHDFRPAFLHIGPTLREHPTLRTVPMLALTATAVPRVQEDIISNLHMNRREGVTIVKRTFDRTNLKITLRRRPVNGITGAFEDMVMDLARAIGSSSRGKTTTTTGGGVVGGGSIGRRSSTIVYCSTKKEVDDITMKITQLLAHQIIRLEQQKMKQQHTNNANATTTMSLEHATQLASTLVQPYHAGLSHAQRSDSHTNFLIGRVTIIVATVAFGMGIDKPDIRRVVHWGPCKTVEEYYQQIGRAGRDGLPAECIMYFEPNDFVKYKDDFYLGGLSGSAKFATMRSMDALRDFAMSTNGCRRASLLTFFEETPSFGKYCGTCDLCVSRKDHGDDYERDFQWEGARVILAAVMACPNQVS